MLGLDFGTTNSALASAGDDGVTLARFTGGEAGDDRSATFRSVVYFDPHERERGLPRAFAGPSAIARYLAGDGSGRLIQSLKSQLASRLFTSTRVFGKTYALESLIAVILRGIRAQAEAQLGPLGRRLVVGRPVRFTHAETDDDDRFAVERLRAALAEAGFDEVVLEYEPVAAAYHYERRLDHDELVLIADFGGGTSDFCLIEVGPSLRSGRKPRRILGTEGVALAGDAFDGEIVRQVVAPALGMGSLVHLPMDDARTIEVPPWIYQKLRRWHHLSFLKSKETMDLLHELRRRSLEPDRLDALLHVVDHDLGFHMYKAVEHTKIALSRAEVDRFSFRDAPVSIVTDVARGAFEGWIGEELARIAGCVDRLLAKTSVTASAVDRVFMTGGTSLVPAVRGLFAARFGEERLRAGDELTSVALGLALRARDVEWS
ncbi:MAG: Hsp70 family protein [Polyangiales bacterium]